MQPPTPIFIILLIACAFFSGAARAQDVEVVATVNETTIGTEEQLVYSIEIRGATVSSISTPEPPATRNLALVQRTPSTQRNMTILNGNLQQSVSFRWRFRPAGEGPAAIEPVQVRVDGRNYATQRIRINVVPQSQRPGRPQAGRQQQLPFRFPPSPGQGGDDDSAREIDSQDLFIRAIPSTREAYQNEQITIEYQLFFRDGIQLRHSRLAGSWDAGGFWREEFDVDTRPIPTSVVENGLLYHMIVLKRVAVFPTRPGQLSVDPLKIETEAYFPFGTSDPFERFFSLRSQFETVELVSDPVEIDVRPLPAGAPEVFNGAVGHFDMRASLDGTEVEVGEPVDVEVTISGTGNLATLEAPPFRPPGIFERYEPDVVTGIERGGQRISGRKTFTYILVPRSNGDYTLPPVEFAYFDPSSNQYEVRRAELGRVRVTGTAAPLAAGSTAEGLPIDDIAGIITTASWESAEDVPLHERTWPYLLLILPPLALGGLYLFERRARRLAHDTEFARGRIAHPLARKHLKKADALLKENEPRLFYEEIESAVMGFIGNRLNVAELGLTRSELDTRLAQIGVEDRVRSTLSGLLAECDQAQYAPVPPDRPAMESAEERASRVIVAIDQAASRQTTVQA